MPEIPKLIQQRASHLNINLALPLIADDTSVGEPGIRALMSKLQSVCIRIHPGQ
jgi:hypothetical protein